MPEPKQERPTETELIAWAIPLIADGCYFTEAEKGKRELTIYDEQPDLEFMEGALLYKRQEHQIAALKRAKELCTPDNILRRCVAYLGTVLAPNIAQQIEIPEYWRLVTGESVEKLDSEKILFAATIPCRATEYCREEHRR